MRILALCVALAAATPAEAFDCGKATTASEKAICADPTARAADAAMSQAFSKLIAAESPSAKSALVAAQGRWIQIRDNACSEDKALGPCLARESAKRRAYLVAEPEAGPGAPGRLAPVVKYVRGGKGRAEIDLQLLKYPAPATPAERAFNAAVEAVINPMDEPEKDDPSADNYVYDREMRLVYASPALISAHVDGYNDSGGAHPSTFSGNVNIDVARGREAAFADLLDAKGAKAVFALCLKQVIAQKKDRLEDQAALAPDDLKELTGEIAEASGQLRAWSFGPDAATIGYDPYAVGAYVEGSYFCELPYATLKPLAKPEFPLPAK